jgi:para-aminobenzoate synthetase/4-amino-4-deoxychorismate lyase
MSAPDSLHECFALLDDCDASSVSPSSRLYRGHVGTLRCRSAAELPALLEQMQHALGEGRHAVALFSYELGEQLHGIAPREQAPAELAQVLLFSECKRLSANEVRTWLETQEQGMRNAGQGSGANADIRPAGVAQIRAGASDAEIGAAIGRIHGYIEAGDTYQTNYTYRLQFAAYGSLPALYLRLRARQPVPYGALIGLPDGRAVVSLSPELFVQNRAGQLTARPMKGTAAAGPDPMQEALRTSALATSTKDRAENLMIVDLLRNDLGRIAALGTVHVPQLFEVSRYSNVLQMTSTVQAEARTDVSLAELFNALYPCGSITGAPKRRTMQIIRELENAPRGYYTGAIGWFEPAQGRQQFGDFCLSVPIRTLQLEMPGADGMRTGEMGVGAGIVYDSVADDEIAECRLKASFLTELPHEFELFETIHATREAGCRHLERHLQRLARSAAWFGFGYVEYAVHSALAHACSELTPELSYRLRLSLKHDGSCDVQSAPLTPLSEPVKLLLAAQPTDADDLFLRHKTSVRNRYDAAWRAAEARGAFDALFCNRDGEVTEGARSSVFVKLQGKWYTPPLAAGVLPGVMRSVLLEDPAWQARERSLTLDDVRRAEQVVVCNALRGALSATVEWHVTPIEA